MNQRVLQNTPAVVTATLLDASGDVPTPLPDAATVTITRDDGTPVATAAEATNLGDGRFSYELSSGQTALLDRLTLNWTSLSSGTTRTTVEVVGDFLFTVADARAMRPLDNTSTYTTADITAMRTTVEDALEDACGVAFVPRYDSATLNGGDSLLRLTPYLRTVRWASTTAGGVTTPLTADALSVLQISRAGFVSGYPWTVGYGNVRVGYEHGMDRPPERIRRAALLLAKVWLVSGPVDDRATSFSSAETGATYSMVVPGRGGSITGVPEVDATIQQYRMPVLA